LTKAGAQQWNKRQTKERFERFRVSLLLRGMTKIAFSGNSTE
jgi:hypothetical protein